MLNNRKFRIALSLLIAVFLWAYVVGTVDPNTTKTLRNVPITLNHTAELGERGLAVSSMNTESIDIEVTGSRTALSDITANDITATVDMASASEGENELSIMVRVPPGGITVNERSASKVTVMVENLIQKTVDVSVVYTGTFEEGQGGDTLEIATPSVIVTGAESLVNMVDSVRGAIDASRLGSEPTDIICQLQPLSSEGNPVSGVVLSQESVAVTSVLSETKTVDLSVYIEDYSSDGLARDVEIPETIDIVGRGDILADITYLEALPVDVTNVAESGDIPLEFELPEGVSLADKDKEIALKLTVSPMTTKTLTYAVSEIVLEGQKSTLSYTIQPGTQVVLTCTDSSTKLSEISKTDFKVYCDVSQFTAGSNTCEVIVELEKELYGLSYTPETIDISVSANR